MDAPYYMWKQVMHSNTAGWQTYQMQQNYENHKRNNKKTIRKRNIESKKKENNKKRNRKLRKNKKKKLASLNRFQWDKKHPPSRYTENNKQSSLNENVIIQKSTKNLSTNEKEEKKPKKSPKKEENDQKYRKRIRQPWKADSRSRYTNRVA